MSNISPGIGVDKCFTGDGLHIIARTQSNKRLKVYLKCCTNIITSKEINKCINYKTIYSGNSIMNAQQLTLQVC